MNIIFGPINSRRFGFSLGIDLSPALKQCNFDCVYCELKQAKAIAKMDYIVGVKDIIEQLQFFLTKKIPFDVLTLTANGEPSLYPNLKELITVLRGLKLDKKILILSNGTAVLNEKQFNALLDLDMVKLSLDSVIKESFLRINKPLKEIDLHLMIEKMITFSKIFKGELIIEILVVKGINDNEKEFKALNEVLQKINPTRVDISTIDRPPSYPVKGVSEEKLLDLSLFVENIPVFIARRNEKKQNMEFSTDELLKMLQLRAQSEFDVKALLSLNSQAILDNLIKKDLVKIYNLGGVKFYKV
ncbi:radical SAM protein [Campylobacter novaezeelandiae]|uniref:radical SAM protein n=1 Tax=Campylobacter novaezeelandiae TaxID=2267891 RepID=UPI0010376A5D|nr:radical SAM protein [Campylobacter novaezeelandiae]QWU79794.1 wyosine [tRNA(Phe)-imidazoG37] synthetase, radical SAM superfamily [Campylobacter novaezeelandiae]TBR78247.1 radical SAM protein [Campylobacter novaezeelandiae]